MPADGAYGWDWDRSGDDGEGAAGQPLVARGAICGGALDIPEAGQGQGLRWGGLRLGILWTKAATAAAGGATRATAVTGRGYVATSLASEPLISNGCFQERQLRLEGQVTLNIRSLFPAGEEEHSERCQDAEGARPSQGRQRAVA